MKKHEHEHDVEYGLVLKAEQIKIANNPNAYNPSIATVHKLEVVREVVGIG
jgi:hypothetical protein